LLIIEQSVLRTGNLFALNINRELEPNPRPPSSAPIPNPNIIPPTQVQSSIRIQCICQKETKYSNNGNLPLIQCTKCGMHQHRCCVKDNAQINPYECPRCLIVKLDPLLPVDTTLFACEPFTVPEKNLRSSQNFQTFQIPRNIVWPRASHRFYIRCIRLDGKSNEHAWPLYGQLSVNMKNLENWQVPKDTLQHKRRDYPRHIKPEEVCVGENKIFLVKNTSNTGLNDAQVKMLDDDEKFTYVASIVEVEVLTPEILIQRMQANKPSIEVSRAQFTEKLKAQFAASSEDCICEAIDIPCCDPFLPETMMTLPGFGEKCKHIQCFDIANYVKMNERARMWKCPHCSVKTYVFTIDTYMEALLNAIKALKFGIPKILVDKNGIFNINNTHQAEYVNGKFIIVPHDGIVVQPGTSFDNPLEIMEDDNSSIKESKPSLVKLENLTNKSSIETRTSISTNLNSDSKKNGLSPLIPVVAPRDHNEETKVNQINSNATDAHNKPPAHLEEEKDCIIISDSDTEVIVADNPPKPQIHNDKPIIHQENAKPLQKEAGKHQMAINEDSSKSHKRAKTDHSSKDYIIIPKHTLPVPKHTTNHSSLPNNIPIAPQIQRNTNPNSTSGSSEIQQPFRVAQNLTNLPQLAPTAVQNNIRKPVFSCKTVNESERPQELRKETVSALRKEIQNVHNELRLIRMGYQKCHEKKLLNSQEKDEIFKEVDELENRFEETIKKDTELLCNWQNFQLFREEIAEMEKIEKKSDKIEDSELGLTFLNNAATTFSKNATDSSITKGKSESVSNNSWLIVSTGKLLTPQPKATPKTFLSSSKTMASPHKLSTASQTKPITNSAKSADSSKSIKNRSITQSLLPINYTTPPYYPYAMPNRVGASYHNIPPYRYGSSNIQMVTQPMQRPPGIREIQPEPWGFYMTQQRAPYPYYGTNGELVYPQYSIGIPCPNPTSETPHINHH